MVIVVCVCLFSSPLGILRSRASSAIRTCEYDIELRCTLQHEPHYDEYTAQNKLIADHDYSITNDHAEDVTILAATQNTLPRYLVDSEQLSLSIL